MTMIMNNLITNKFYNTREEVEKKLNIFFAFNVLTETDYDQLMKLTDSKYTV